MIALPLALPANDIFMYFKNPDIKSQIRVCVSIDLFWGFFHVVE